MARQFPKYEPTPTSTAETPAAVPELQICKINNGQLHLPPDVRAQFMGDPVRSAEWKRLLAEFDRKWSTSSSGESGRSTDAAVEQIVAAEGDGDGESGQQDEEPRGSSWESAFVGEPTTKEDMEAKYTTAHSFPMADNLVGVIVEGPKLFVSSLGDVQWSVDEPFLCFGAGTWLLGWQGGVVLGGSMDVFSVPLFCDGSFRLLSIETIIFKSYSSFAPQNF